MSSNDNDLQPLRFSRLKLMGKSAAHYVEGYGEETGPMRKGTALHAFLLGRKEKIAVMTYKALALYLHVYPAERVKLKKLLGERKTEQIRQAERTLPAQVLSFPPVLAAYFPPACCYTFYSSSQAAGSGSL